MSLAITALCLVSPPVSANISDLLEMSDKADQADKQDLQDALDQANSCTRARNFSCSEEQLRKASKLVNGSGDRKALNSATANFQAEKQRVKDEAEARAKREREEAEAAAEHARQMQLAEERREVAREKAERQARNDRIAEENEASRLASRNSNNDLINDTLKFSAETNRRTTQLYGQAQQNQRDRDAERQRQADEARAVENERIRRQNQRVAQQEQDRIDQQAQARRDAQARQREQDRQQEQAAQRQRQSSYASSSSSNFGSSQAPSRTQEKRAPEYKDISVGSGRGNTCLSRQIAEDLANTGTKNRAYKICGDLGDGWSFDKIKFAGYLECTKCSGGEYICEITGATHVCKH
jgi:hypothetical protein